MSGFLTIPSVMFWQPLSPSLGLYSPCAHRLQVPLDHLHVPLWFAGGVELAATVKETLDPKHQTPAQGSGGADGGAAAEEAAQLWRQTGRRAGRAGLLHRRAGAPAHVFIVYTIGF